MGIARRWSTWAPHLAFLYYFVALFLAGVWHGATWNFVVFGLLNGVGVSAAKLWENAILARSGRRGLREYLAAQPIRLAARVGTFHFVCLTMFFLQFESTGTLLSYGRKLLALLPRGVAG
jgi:D-alanyl-lipoteichoic acid acyltransferase DltB (MBOAT superfamily)